MRTKGKANPAYMKWRTSTPLTDDDVKELQAIRHAMDEARTVLEEDVELERFTRRVTVADVRRLNQVLDDACVVVNKLTWFLYPEGAPMRRLES